MVIPVLDARKDPRTDTLEQIASRAGEHPVMPLWALTTGRAGTAGYVPARAGLCGDWRQQEPTARPW
jgi:hypothetical protein